MTAVTTRDTCLLATLLLALSAVLYCTQFLVFDDAHLIGLNLLGDLAFLPLQVLMVTVLLDRVMSVRDRQARLHKLNMVIGTFFSDTGTPLLRVLAPLTQNSAEISAHACIGPDWSPERVRDSVIALGAVEPRVSLTPEAMEALRDTLCDRRGFLISLLENPVLMEHESFTDLLWAVFHLQEELAARASLHGLPDSDLRHLTTDAERAYARLLRSWVAYMQHLRSDYPYLFSFAARTNPLRTDACAEVVQ